MNVTCIDAPPEVDELELAGLTRAPSHKIRPPRIAESPVSFECKMLTSLVTGPRQTVVIGRVVCAHIEDRFVQDKDRCHIDTPGAAIDRPHAWQWLVRPLPDLFQMDRPTWAEWQRNGARQSRARCHECGRRPDRRCDTPSSVNRHYNSCLWHEPRIMVQAAGAWAEGSKAGLGFVLAAAWAFRAQNTSLEQTARERKRGRRQPVRDGFG